MGEAALIYRSKMIYPDGAIKEMVIWKLPATDQDWLHAFKYRLFYGTRKDGCLVRYDNERGKGDHRHIKDQEESYAFSSVEKLVADFQRDIDQIRGGEAWITRIK